MASCREREFLNWDVALFSGYTYFFTKISNICHCYCTNKIRTYKPYYNHRNPRNIFQLSFQNARKRLINESLMPLQRTLLINKIINYLNFKCVKDWVFILNLNICAIQVYNNVRNLTELHTFLATWTYSL